MALAVNGEEMGSCSAPRMAAAKEAAAQQALDPFGHTVKLYLCSYTPPLVQGRDLTLLRQSRSLYCLEYHVQAIVVFQTLDICVFCE
jgi:hypothetical protein